MASWKKVVVSGSNAELAQITSSGLDATRVVFTGTGGALTGSGGLTYTHSTEQLSATKIVNDSAVADSRLTGSMSGSFVGTFANSDGSTVGAQTLQQTMDLGSTTSVAITSSAGVMLSGSGGINAGATDVGIKLVGQANNSDSLIAFTDSLDKIHSTNKGSIVLAGTLSKAAGLFGTHESLIVGAGKISGSNGAFNTDNSIIVGGGFDLSLSGSQRVYSSIVGGGNEFNFYSQPGSSHDIGSSIIYGDSLQHSGSVANPTEGGLAIFGKFNKPEAGTRFYIGNGESSSDRRNMMTVNDIGDGFFSGSLNIRTNLTASIITASKFFGDGTGITGVTAEWDGTRNGDAEITGSLILSGSAGTQLEVSGSAGFRLNRATGDNDSFTIDALIDDGETPAFIKPAFKVEATAGNVANIILGDSSSTSNTAFYNNISTLNLIPEYDSNALPKVKFGTSTLNGGTFPSASIQFGNNQPTSTTGLGVDLGVIDKFIRNVYSFNFSGSQSDIETGSFAKLTASVGINAADFDVIAAGNATLFDTVGANDLTIGAGTTTVKTTLLESATSVKSADFDVIAAGNVTLFDSVGDNDLTIGATNTTVKLVGDKIELGNGTGDIVDIKGDLRVAGTSSFTNATNLSVADKYILLNSGSAGANSDSGGIVIQGPNQNVGELFGYVSGSSVNANGLNRRWGIATHFNASASGDFTADAFMATVAVDTAASDPAAEDYLDYAKPGNIYSGNDGEIYIYAQ